MTHFSDTQNAAHGGMPDEAKITLVLGVQELKRRVDQGTLGDHIQATGLDRRDVLNSLHLLNQIDQSIPSLDNYADPDWADGQWLVAAAALQAMSDLSTRLAPIEGIPPSAAYHGLADNQEVYRQSEDAIASLVGSDQLPRWQRVMLADLLAMLAEMSAEGVGQADPDFVWYRSLAIQIGLQVSLIQQMQRLSPVIQGTQAITNFAGLGHPAVQQVVDGLLLAYGTRRFLPYLTDAVHVGHER